MHAAVPHSQYTFGNWAFYSPPDLATLNGATIQNQINTALAKDYVRGLCLRCQWNDLEPTQNNYNFAIPDKGLQMAQAVGKDFSLRVTAGKLCPPYLLSSMRTYTLEGSVRPHACDTSGNPEPNFMARYAALTTQMVNWCLANRVTILHHSWFGYDFSEIYGANSTDAGSDAIFLPPSPGYDAAGNNWRNAHIALFDQIWATRPADMTYEIPFSGKYDDIPGTANALFTHINTVVTDYSPTFFQNSNTFPNYAGSYTGNLTRGAQPLRPGDYSDTGWNAIYGGGTNTAGQERSIRVYGVEYMELFTNQFTVVDEGANADPTWPGDPATTAFLGSHEPDLASCARAFLLRGGKNGPKATVGLA